MTPCEACTCAFDATPGDKSDLCSVCHGTGWRVTETEDKSDE